MTKAGSLEGGFLGCQTGGGTRFACTYTGCHTHPTNRPMHMHTLAAQSSMSISPAAPPTCPASSFSSSTALGAIIRGCSGEAQVAWVRHKRVGRGQQDKADMPAAAASPGEQPGPRPVVPPCLLRGGTLPPHAPSPLAVSVSYSRTTSSARAGRSRGPSLPPLPPDSWRRCVRPKRASASDARNRLRCGGAGVGGWVQNMQVRRMRSRRQGHGQWPEVATQCLPTYAVGAGTV